MGDRMKRFIEGEDRKQVALLPECLDDFVAEDNPVRIIEAFVEELDLECRFHPLNSMIAAVRFVLATNGRSGSLTGRLGGVRSTSAMADRTKPLAR